MPIDPTDQVAVHTRRLCKLADRLERRNVKVEVPTRTGPGVTIFNMEQWGLHKGKHKPSTQNYCGTAACALGHAAMIPEFHRAGLRYTWEFDDCKQRWVADVCLTADGHKLDNDAAGAKFFGLSQNEAWNLFFATAATKDEIVARLRYLADNRVEMGDDDCPPCERPWSAAYRPE